MTKNNSSSNVKIKYKGVELSLGAQGGPAWILVLGVLIFSGTGTYLYLIKESNEVKVTSSTAPRKISVKGSIKHNQSLNKGAAKSEKALNKYVENHSNATPKASMSETPCITISFDHRNRERYCTNCACSFKHNSSLSSWTCLSVDAMKGQYIHVHTEHPTKQTLIARTGRKIAPSSKRAGYARFLLPQSGVYNIYISGKQTKGFLEVPPVNRRHRKWCKPFTKPY